MPDQAILDALDFALALEILESEFYKAVLGRSDSAAQNDRFATVRATAASVPGAVNSFDQIQMHEAAHVETLLSLGATNVFELDATTFDFTGARGAGDGPFAGATTDFRFLLEMAQALEDTGVRAYKGQAALLMSERQILENALAIHSVEARHASRIRRMRRLAAGAGETVRLSGTVRGGGAGAAGGSGGEPEGVLAVLAQVYGAGANSTSAPSESSTSQAGIEVAAMPGGPPDADAASEAFDEPLDRGDVIAIVQRFVVPVIS